MAAPCQAVWAVFTDGWLFFIANHPMVEIEHNRIIRDIGRGSAVSRGDAARPVPLKNKARLEAVPCRGNNIIRAS